MNNFAKLAKSARTSNEEAPVQSNGKIHYAHQNGSKFKMNSFTSATHIAVRLRKKAKETKEVVAARKKKQMWAKFMSARDCAGGERFNQSAWLQDHHDKKGRADRKKRKAEERKRRRRDVVPELPKMKEVVLEDATMTPFSKAKRKRPIAAHLLPLPTPMGKNNFKAIMDRYETYEEGMQHFHAKTVTRTVSKDFVVFVLNQERRQREAAKRGAEQAVENGKILKRALARLKNKQLAGAFHTWQEMWDTMKRMRSLMQRVAGGSKSAIFARWIEYRIISVEERMTSFNNLSEYATLIQSWIRTFQAIAYVDQFRRDTSGARVIQRMVRAWHARNILTKAKDHEKKMDDLRRRVRNRLFYAVQHRIFNAWSEWAYNIAALKRFVKKHMLGGVTKAFHAWIAGVLQEKEEKENMQKLQKFMQKNMMGGVRKGFLAWLDAMKNIRILRLAKNKLVHGKIHRIWVAWSEHVQTMKRVQRFMNRWKNGAIMTAFETWHEEAHRSARIRHLARKLFLGCLQKSYQGWKMVWSDQLRRKNVAARSIQGLYHVWYGKNFLKRARQQIYDDELAEKKKLQDAGVDTERHALMKIGDNDPVVTQRLRLLHNELQDAMESSTGFFDSKSLHDNFDLHQQGTFVMSSLRQELINETLRLVQRRKNQAWYNDLAESQSNKWGGGWERNYKYSPEDQIRRDSLDVHTLHDHFPEQGMSNSGKSIVFQGTFQDFEEGMRGSLKEWSFMETQGWISHKQYIQWMVRGAITNVKDPEKKLVGWNLLREVLDENTFAEVSVVIGNNELIDMLGGQHMAQHYMNDAVHT